MISVFVRDATVDGANDAPAVMSVAEMIEEARVGHRTATSEISRSLDLPFFPVPNALRADSILREAFAVALKLPRFLRYRQARPFLFLGVIPWLMLFELDREIAADDVGNASSRMVLDIFLVLTCARDLVRPLPRHPRVTAIVFSSAAARFVFLLTRSCGVGAHPLIVAAPVLGFAAALATLIVSPTRALVAADILKELQLPPTHPAAAPENKISNRALAGTLAVAGLLPIALLLSARFTGIWGEALVMVTWGFALPQQVVPNVDDRAPRGSTYFSRANLIASIATGVALTAALTGGVHYFVDAAAHVVECFRGAGAMRATQFIAREGVEVTRNVREAQRDLAFFVMTVAVAPIVEERIYRGMLQRIVAERFGPSRGVAIAASIFGVAHLGIYRVAIYQTVLLGVAFGAVFEEGGLIASMATHALWNLYLLI